MRLIAVGRLRAGPEADLFARYNARLRPPLTVTEVAEGRGAATEIKRRESEALDSGGAAPDSERLAALLERWLGSSRPVCFLLGGAEGLDSTVMARADAALSLGPMTWPHLLVRAMLAEQLFRARAIASGHPYHRAGRPG
jgi:23S rRNA (pseudouridine1915-N3)-methyltransferase